MVIKHSYFISILLLFTVALSSINKATAQCNLTADFSFSPNNSPAGTEIQFQPQIQNAQGTVSYSWDFGDGNTSSSSAPLHQYAFHACQGNTYTVSLTATDTAGCTASVQKTVTIDNDPHVSLTDLDPVSSFSNCENSPSLSNPDFTLNVDNSTQHPGSVASYQVQWGDGQTNTYLNGDFPVSHTYTSLDIFNLTVTVTDTSGCTWDTTYTVTNQSNPAIGISSPGYTQGCAPQTFKFVMSQYKSNSPGTYYVWDFGDGTPNITWNYDQPYINDTITHTFDTTSCHQPNNYFTVSVTAYNACDYTKATVSNIRIYQPPVVDIKTSTDTVCTGDPVQFVNNTITGFGYSCNSVAAYNWDFDDPASANNTSTQQSPSHTYHSPGDYKIVLEADNGICGVKADTIELTVVEEPEVSVEADTSEICKNGIVNFTNFTSGTSPDYKWSVSPASFNNVSGSMTDSNLTLQFLQEGNYDITLTASNYCGADDTTITIKVNNTPEADIAALPDFCGSATINPTAQYDGHGSAIHTYNWTFNGGTPSSSAAAQPGTIQYNSPGNYHVIVEAANHCGSAVDTAILVIHDLPAVTAGSTTDTICAGDSLQLNASGAVAYNWTPSGSLSATDISSPVATPSNPTQYIVEGTDTNSCVNHDTLDIHVNQLPVVNLSANPAVVCENDTAVVTATGALSYNFQSSTPLIQNTGASVSLAPTTDAVIYVTGTDQMGCVSDDSINIQVNHPPALTFSPATPEICVGDTAQLTVSGSQSYQWMLNGSQIATGSSIPVSPSQTTSYTVIAHDQYGCRSVDSVEVKVLPLPVVSITPSVDTICEGQNIQLTASGTSSYLWHPASSLNKDTGTKVNASPPATTSYYVTGTDNNGCSNTDTSTIVVKPVPNITVTPSNTDICSGDSVILTASGAPKLSWSPATGLSAVSGDTVIAKPVSSVTYTVSGSNGAGCQSSATTTINLHNPPVLSFAPANPSVCTGDSVQLNVSGAATYSWSPSSGLSSTSGSTVYASPTSDTTYHVSGTDAIGCSSNGSVDVTVDPLPSVKVTATDTSICEGEIIQLSGTGATNYVWTDDNGNVAGSGQNITVQPLSNTTYYGSGTNANGCPATDSVNITVTPKPDVTHNISSSSICTNDSVTITVSGASTWKWFKAGINTGFTGDSLTVSPASSVTYSVIGIGATGCTDTVFIPVTVTPKPTLQVSAASSSICEGDTTTLNISGASNYSWSPATGLSQTSGSNVKAFPQATQNYTVSGTDTNGCQADTTITVNVDPVPQLSIMASDTIICKGLTTQLTATGASNYTWSPANSLNTGIGDTVMATPMANTTYKVTGVNSFGCDATATIDIQAFQGSQLTATPSSASICMGDTTQITVDGAATYSWSNTAGIVQISGNTALLAPTANSTYQVTGVDSAGCIHTVNIPVEVKALPTVNAYSDLTSLCTNDSVRLWSTGADVYQWYKNGIPYSQQQQFYDQPQNSATYTVTGTDTNGCSNTATVNTNVNPAPTLTVVAADSSVCSGSSTTITASGAANYSWSPASSLNTSSGSSVVASPSADTKYYITATSPEGCEITDSITVMVDPQPKVNLSVSQNNICFGDSVVLTASGASTYDWNHIQTNISSSKVSPDSTFTYTVTGTTAEGCSDQASQTVVVHPAPKVDFVTDSILCAGSPFNINNNLVNASTFSWDMGDGSVSAAANPTHTYSAAGNYDITLEAATSHGCTDSLKKTVQVIGQPSAGFALSTDSGCTPLQVQYNNMSSGNYVNYHWDMGNGMVSNSSSPSQNTYQAGQHADTSYVITLSLSNKCGTSIQKDTVLVKTSPEASFGLSNNYGCSPLTVQMANNSTGNPKAFLWDFGDGNTSTNGSLSSHTFNYNGSSDTTYDVSLISFNSCGTDTAQSSVTVRPQTVNAFYTPSRLSGCAPLTVDFSNYSTPGSVMEWDFDDGNVSTVTDPIHTFTIPGTYEVELLVYDSCSVDTMTRTISVSTPPFADYIMSQDTICPGEQIAFTNLSVNPVGITWDFDDGTTSGNTHPTHTFNSSGVYHVKMVMKEQGTYCTDSVIKTIHVRPGPDAGFTSSSLSGCMPLHVNLLDTSSGAKYYNYLFDNGNSSAQPSPAVTYTQQGTYTIWQKVENDYGCRDSARLQVIVHPKPVSNFTLPKTLACDTPATVQVNNQSIGAVDYQWNFGNGQSSVLQHPQITYHDPGTFNIRLISSNMYQCKDTSNATFTVSQPINPDFSTSPSEGCEPLKVHFTNKTSNQSSSYLWDFGDSYTSSADDPVHTYDNAGVYSVRLIATNSDGCADTLKYNDTIEVFAKPAVDFDYEISQDPRPNTGKVAFNSYSSPGVSWYWNFDDGTNDTLANPVHSFPQHGVYNVLLTVTNANGCSNEVMKSVQVDAVKGLFIPNALAPDDMNEGVSKFKPKGKGIKDYWIAIYDKWGNKIWESAQLENGSPAEAWDGTYQGDPLPAGVYVWKARAIFEDGSVWKGMKSEGGKYHPHGHVTLIR